MIRVKTLQLSVLVALYLGMGVQPAQAQFYGALSDMEMFAPAELDFDGTLASPSHYFFRYDRVSFAFTGENFVLGSPTATAQSIEIYRGSGIPVPSVINAVRSSPPRSKFAWGDRYEFGYSEDGHGWLVGIIDGPDQRQRLDFGFGQEFGGYSGQDDTVSPEQPAIGDDVENPIQPEEQDGVPNSFQLPQGPNQLASPLGSVAILFDHPVGFMDGFIDVIDGVGFGGGIPGGVLPTDTNGDFILDGDGFADDLDEDGQHGPDYLDIEDPGNVPETIVDIPPDFDDLVTFIPSWRLVTVRNNSELKGIELMKTWRLRNHHFMAKNQINELDLFLGARYLRFRDQFMVNGEGGVLGESFWNTWIRNNLVGPQIGMKWLHQRGRVSFNMQGRFLFGYNITDWQQRYGLGEDLIPGQHNHPLFFNPTNGSHRKQSEEFSPMAEMRVETTFHITRGFAFRLGWTGIFIDNIRRAAQSVRYELPNMGFVNSGTQEIFINGAHFGADFTF